MCHKQTANPVLCPSNATFVNFDDEVPTKPLDAAAQAWKKVCTNPVDRKVEEELRKVRAMFLSWAGHSALLCCVGKVIPTHLPTPPRGFNRPETVEKKALLAPFLWAPKGNKILV